MSTVKAPEIRTPWIKNLGDVPATLEYSNNSMFDSVAETAKKYPNIVAYDFMGSHVTYQTFVAQVFRCAKALKAIGIKENDKVTICMPNAPQTVIMFYAVNVVGAISNMIHPLSAEKEIEFYLRDSNSVACITLDQFYPKFVKVRENVEIKKLIITSVADALTLPMKIGYKLTEGRKIAKIPSDADVIYWKDFLKSADSFTDKYAVTRIGSDPAVILYSGGTTGATKGILLTNKNFNALGTQIIATNRMFRPGDKMLAVMPMFHGFGLGVSIHSMLANGGRCILIPRFNAESYAELLKKHRPNFIAGVPTLYEALLRLPSMNSVDLSCLKGVFSGGDSLSIELKKRFDFFLQEHNATITVREGYGTTECVTASCLTPVHWQKEGSIGLPFPDTYYKIVKPGTQVECEYDEEGEICISGPTVMVEYVNQPEETANTLKKHSDGLTWLHTGDLGTMDSDGFIYFKQRIKRMIVTSGYNVYPSQIENILDAHRFVHMSCVIGVPDPLKMQRVKAFVMLKPDVDPTEEVKQALLDYCKENIAKYAMPKEIEFVDQFPKTLVGKVAYRELEKLEAERRAAEQQAK